MLCALPEHFAVCNFSGTQQIVLLPCVDTKTHGTNRAHNKGSFCCVPHKSHHTAKKNPCLMCASRQTHTKMWTRRCSLSGRQLVPCANTRAHSKWPMCCRVPNVKQTAKIGSSYARWPTITFVMCHTGHWQIENLSCVFLLCSVPQVRHTAKWFQKILILPSKLFLLSTYYMWYLYVKFWYFYRLLLYLIILFY